MPSIENFLSKKLQQFTIVDLAFTKMVYFVVGLLIGSLYTPLQNIGWGFYLIVGLLSALPLWIHFFSLKGDMWKQMQAYAKTNNPSNQVLLFLTMLFFSLFFGVLFPVLLSGAWWVYVIVIVVLAIKPLMVTWFW